MDGSLSFFYCVEILCFLKEQYVIYILNNLKISIYRQTLGNVEILAHLIRRLHNDGRGISCNGV